MRNYWNHEETEDFIRFFGGVLATEEMVKDWIPHGSLNKEEQRNIKTALTYMKKTLHLIESRMDKSYWTKVINMCKIYNGKSIGKASLNIPPDDYEDIASMTLDSTCKPCHCKHDHNCPFREMYKLMGIPPIDEKAPCPWEQPVFAEEQPVNVVNLPCKIGQRVQVFKDDRWINSYVDEFYCNKNSKGKWLVSVKALDYALPIESWGFAIKPM